MFQDLSKGFLPGGLTERQQKIEIAIEQGSVAISLHVGLKSNEPRT
jgi:hypothetical protein